MPTSASHSAKLPSLLGDYFAFLKNPTYESHSGTAKETFINVWRLYSGHVCLILLMAAGIQTLSRWIISIEDNKLGDLLESMPIFQFLLLAVVFAPLTEELIFRLPLRFSRLNLFIPILSVLIPVSFPIIQRLDSWWIECLSWGLLGGFIYLLWAQILGRINRRLGEQFCARHLLKFVYGSSIVFGLLHIMNYPKQAWIVAPVLVLPQVTLGLMLAYVRIKYGFIWAVLTHGLHNLLASSPIFFLALGSSQLRQRLLNNDADIELLPRDQLLQGIFVIWMLGLILFVIMTAFHLIQEWRQTQPQEQM